MRLDSRSRSSCPAVFEPLQMRDSYFGPPREAAARQYDEAGKALSPTQCIGDAAAGFNTTARDMEKLLLEYGRAAADSRPF